MTNTFTPFSAADFGVWGAANSTGVATGSVTGATIQPTPAAPAFDPGPQSLEWSPQPASFYFEETSHQGLFKAHRNQRQQHNIMTRPGPSWTEEDELKLVDYLWRDWFGEPYPAETTWSYTDLDLDALPAKSLRKFALQPFKINYETYQEIKLRLLNTVIAIKGHPFLVQKIAHTPQGFKLAVSDGFKTWAVMYNDLTDLRSLPPMYVNSPSSTGWLCRIPGRVYQQGMNRQNTVLKAIDGKGSVANLDASYFVKTFNKRQTRKWDPTLKSLLECGDLSSVRLSDDVAVKSDKNKIIACYRGRFLGKINDNDISVGDEDDLLQQWIEKSVKEVGLELRA